VAVATSFVGKLQSYVDEWAVTVDTSTVWDSADMATERSDPDGRQSDTGRRSDTG
jgi:hypothetical protein